MSSSSLACNFFLKLFIMLCITRISSSLVLQVTKDASSLQYLTTIHLRKTAYPINLVVHLGGPALWVDCSSLHVPHIPSRSIQCLAAKGIDIHANSRQPICGLGLQNPITGISAVGKLTHGLFEETVQNFMYFCASRLLLHGLATNANGVLGLGKSRISAPSQLSMMLNSDRKFTLCLSSSKGYIAFNEANQLSSRSLTYTPLITREDEYFVNVKSIRVNNKRVALKGVQEAKLSTVVPYTTLQTSIYVACSEAFVSFAGSMNMTRMPSMGGFELCFGSKNVVKSWPSVDFVLQSEMVKWRLEGNNLMVHVTDGVMCFGVLNGGVSPKEAIVLGGYQLEDKVLEFDFGTSMLGFGSNERQNGCSSLRYGKSSFSII